jgi:DNA-binding NarL/FixJ family response regulator
MVGPADQEHVASPSRFARVPVRVLVCDDFLPIRTLARMYLEEHGGAIQVAGEAGSARDVVPIAARERPDVVLLDVSLPGRYELADLVAELRTVSGGAAVVLFSGLPKEMLADEARECGADGYVAKESLGPDLGATVLAAAERRGGVCS